FFVFCPPAPAVAAYCGPFVFFVFCPPAPAVVAYCGPFVFFVFCAPAPPVVTRCDPFVFCDPALGAPACCADWTGFFFGACFLDLFLSCAPPAAHASARLQIKTRNV